MLGCSESFAVYRIALHFERVVRFFDIAKGTHVDIDVRQPRKLASEVFHMNTGSSVVVRRVFVGVDECVHELECNRLYRRVL